MAKIKLESEITEVPDWVAEKLIADSLDESYISRLLLYAKDGNYTYDVKMPYTIREL
jgi:hypothetical protein